MVDWTTELLARLDALAERLDDLETENAGLREVARLAAPSGWGTLTRPQLADQGWFSAMAMPTH